VKIFKSESYVGKENSVTRFDDFFSWVVCLNSTWKWLFQSERERERMRGRERERERENEGGWGRRGEKTSH